MALASSFFLANCCELVKIQNKLFVNPLLAGNLTVCTHFEGEFEKCLQHSLKCAFALCSSQNYLKLLSSLDKDHFYIHVEVPSSRFTHSLFICGWSGNMKEMDLDIGLLTSTGWGGPVFKV
jgi:hypothetical protein